MRVLVVDDEPGICQRLQRELQKEGCEVDYTTSPVGVLERLRNAEQEGRAYALLLLDLRMPKVDGLALLKKIREARLDLDVVIITGYGDEEKAIESIRLGVVDYLRKPISLEALHTAVFRVQQKRAAEEKRALEYSVLVVDDEKGLCERIKRELDKEGYRTAVAYDGLEGLDYFSHNRVDVAIVDIRMPRLGGLEMLEKCREISDDFVSIIVTGHGDQEKAIQALQLGVFNYLRKPISLEELVTSVGKGIELLHLRRGLAARRRELEIETALKELYAQNLERMVEERTRELKETRDYLDNLIRYANAPIIVWNPARKITIFNQAFEKMSGRTEAEMLGQPIDLLFPEEGRSDCMQKIESASKGEYWATVEIPILRKDGEIRIGLWNSANIYSEDGKTLLATVAQGQDITERVRAEERLRLLSSAVEQSTEGIAVSDLEGNLLFANDAFAAMHGYAPQELAGKHLSIFHTPEQMPSVEMANRQIQETGGFSGEIWHVRRDGTVFPTLMHNSLLRDETGNAVGMIGTLRDITERVWSEETLRALNVAAAAVQRAARTPEVVFTAVMKQLQALGLTGAVVLLDETRERFVIRYMALASQALARAEKLVGLKAVGYPLPVERLPIGRQILAGETVFVPDVAALVAPIVPMPARPLMPTAMRLLKMPRGVAAPLSVKGEIIGFLGVSAARLSEADVPTITAFANQMAVALENAHLFEAEREQRELAEALEEAAAVVSSTLEADEVLDRILEQVERIVAGGASSVMLVEDSKVRAVRWRGYERMGVEEQIASFALPITGYPNLVKMVQTGEPVVTLDTAADPNWVPLEDWEWLCSYVGAPIQVSGVTVGFLNVDGTRPGQFGPTDARRLEAFASHAATAIENAGLYRELRNHAEELEQRVQERTAQLQAQYARLDAILRSATDGIVVTGAGGEIIQANPIAQTWLTQTLSPEEAERLRETVCDLARRACLSGRWAEERPETVLELTGLDLQLNAAPIAEAGLEEVTAVVDIHDVSHLKALNRIKSHFVSNISHQFRTPITTIKLYTTLMRRSPEKWEKYLDAVEQGTEQLIGLVEDILQISHIDAGRLAMKPRPTVLNELTEVALASHQALAQDGGLTLEHHPAEPGPVVLVDPQQMMQVLNNLVRNAIQYTPEGGSVVISTGKEEAEGRVWATMTVADTGMGIPEEELPHTFERFFRGEKPLLMQVPGTGLGLAIVKAIVELHGGRVTVESQVGEGSTFTVWLPVSR